MTLYVQQELRERIENSTQVASPSATECYLSAVCVSSFHVAADDTDSCYTTPCA